MIVVTATMITIVEYTSEVRTPAVTPTPATISPTSPLDIIPMPTLIPCALFFKNTIATGEDGTGSGEGEIFLDAITIMTDGVSATAQWPRRWTISGP